MSLIQLSPEAQRALQAVCFVVIAFLALLVASTVSTIITAFYLALRRAGVLKKQRKRSLVLNWGGKISLYGGLITLILEVLLLTFLVISGDLEDAGPLVMLMAISTVNLLIGRIAKREA